MKAIQITFDERLLERLDSDEKVKKAGRSAVIRRAVADYLRKKRRTTIAEAYRRAYGKRLAESDLSGWAEEGVWLDEQRLLVATSEPTRLNVQTNGDQSWC